MWGASKIHLPRPQLQTASIMTTPQDVNTRTSIVVNQESIPVDSDLEVDLEEIQHEAVAEQKRIKEAAQAKLAAACEHIEKKRQERKAREEEERKAKGEEKWKAEEEEAWKWKEEEDKVIREMTWKRQLEVSSSSCFRFV